MLSKHPTLKQVGGQSLVKQSRGEQGSKMPLKQLRGTETRDEEAKDSETGTEVSLAAKVQLCRKEKKRKKKEEKKKKRKRIIKFSFGLPGVILFCRGIKWNGEVKKK